MIFLARLQTLKEMLMKALEKVGVPGHQADKLWKEHIPRWSQDVTDDGTFRLYRQAESGRWQLIDTSTNVMVLVERLAKRWKTEFIDPSKHPSRKRTREDTCSELPPLPPHYRETVQVMIDLAVHQVKEEVRKETNNSLTGLEQNIVAIMQQARLPTADHQQIQAGPATI